MDHCCPQLSFQLAELRRKQSSPTVQDLLKLNKVIRTAKLLVESPCRGVQGDLSREVKNELGARLPCRCLKQGRQLYVVKDSGVCLLVVHVCRTVDRVVGHPWPSLSGIGVPWVSLPGSTDVP